MFKTVLLAIDLNENEGAVRAAGAARLLADNGKADLHVVNVVPDSGMAIVDAALGPGHGPKVLAEAVAALKAFVARELPEVPETRLHVAQGTIYDRIIHTANAIDADTIVVGAHSPELKDYLVGPNAARVARHAKQSVLVVR